MRDFKIVSLENQGVDIDIIDGEAAYLDYEAQTGDQRAALAAYTVKGTLPGQLDYGVSWTAVYSGSSTVSQLNNELQLQIQQEAGSVDGESMTTASHYQAVVLSSGGEVGALIVRG